MRSNLVDGKVTGTKAGSRSKSTPADPVVENRGCLAGSPLQWWRTLPVTALSNELLEEVTRTLSRFALLGEPDWRAAVAGEATAAAAVGIVLRATKDAEQPTGRIDLAMTALLRFALDGNAGAALVMASIIKRMVAGAEGHVLATEWLERGRLLPDRPGCPSKLTTYESADKNR